MSTVIEPPVTQPEKHHEEVETVTIRFAGDSGDGMQLTGTQFTNTFKVGDTITVSGETIRTIATIPSDTSLTVTVAFSTTASSLSYTLSGGNRFAVLGSGYVGVGTSTPTTPQGGQGRPTTGPPGQPGPPGPRGPASPPNEGGPGTGRRP